MLEADEAVAFRGVGRLNVAGTRFCTATLISETVIVTAAHCLFHPRTRERVPLGEFRFVAGLRIGKTAAVRRVVRAVTHPDFAFEGLASPAGVVADLALLELAGRSPAEDAAAFATGDLGAERRPLAIVSYARDRAQAPSIESPCGLASAFAGVAALDCAVNYGASGAPVLQGEEADRRLVAVVSAMGSVTLQRAPGHPGCPGRPLDRAAARGAGRRAAGGVTWVAITRGLRPASRKGVAQAEQERSAG